MTLQDEIRLLLDAPTMNANDVRTLLRRDHDEALQLARDMVESESGDERRALFKRLKPALIAHARAEEREVYDALLRLRGGDVHDLAHESCVEHGLVEDLLEKMTRSRKTESDEWKAHATVLLELLERHIDDEHAWMFDALAERFGDEDREALGRRFSAAKARIAMKAKAA
jgi:Hemerythrin HHE cation binding domain